MHTNNDKGLNYEKYLHSPEEDDKDFINEGNQTTFRLYTVQLSQALEHLLIILIR